MSTPKKSPFLLKVIIWIDHHINSYYNNTHPKSLKKISCCFVIIILTVIFYLLYIFVVWMKKNISNMKNFLKIKSLDWIWCGNSDDAKICRGLDHCVRTHTYIYYTFRTTCRNNIADGSRCTLCCNWVQTIQLVIWFFFKKRYTQS